MISLNDVLLAMSNIPVDDPTAEIWGRQMQGGYRIIEYTGTLPITINANGDALLDYRIYGASSGVGVATESGEPAGYKLPMTIGDGNTAQSVPVYIGENQLTEGEYVSYGEQKIYKRTENLIPSPEAQTQTSNGVTATCDGNGVYTFTGTVGENYAHFEFPIEEFTTPNLSDTNFVISLFNTKGLSQADTISIGVPLYIYPANRVIKNPSLASNKKVSKIAFNFQPNRETNFTMSPMLVLGTVAPSQFVPHIAPTDPPVPLPEIPTIDGTTIIDYDGDPKPSQMYVKYKDKSGGA